MEHITIYHLSVREWLLPIELWCRVARIEVQSKIHTTCRLVSSCVPRVSQLFSIGDLKNILKLGSPLKTPGQGEHQMGESPNRRP